MPEEYRKTYSENLRYKYAVVINFANTSVHWFLHTRTYKNIFKSFYTEIKTIKQYRYTKNKLSWILKKMLECRKKC